MAANTSPIFGIAGDTQSINSITAANTTADITSGTSYLVYTAPTDGGYVSHIVVKANPANNTAATVMRVWWNNGLTTGTAANSAIIREANIPATTASNSSATTEVQIPIGMALDATERLYLTIGTAPGGSGAFTATAVATRYA